MSKAVMPVAAIEAQSPELGFFRTCRVTLLVGIALRLAVAPFTSISVDMGVWATSVIHGIEGINLYSRPGFSYPPLWGYLLHAGGYLARLAGVAPESVARSPASWSVLAIRDGQLSSLVTTP